MEQPNKHEEKQDHVRGERDNGIKPGDCGVGYHTDVCYRQLYTMDPDNTVYEA